MIQYSALDADGVILVELVAKPTSLDQKARM